MTASPFADADLCLASAKIVLDSNVTSALTIVSREAGLDRQYKVREFAEFAGVTVRALHHYERLGLLKPTRTAAGYRVYGLVILSAWSKLSHSGSSDCLCGRSRCCSIAIPSACLTRSKCSSRSWREKGSCWIAQSAPSTT